MLKRDFNLSNKEYLKKNKFVLLGVGIFIILGVIIATLFGFNGNFELTGYYELEVNVGAVSTSGYASKIGGIINQYGGKYEGYQVYSEGDNTTIIVRYLNKLSSEKQQVINSKVEDLSTGDIEITIIKHNGTETGHNRVNAIVSSKDYLYTSLTILLLVIIATIFAYVRYNGASAMSMLMSCIMATLTFVCLTAILRITVGRNFFGIIILLNLLILYGCINFFETIRQSSWLQAGKYAEAVEEGLQKSKFRLCILSIAIFVIGLLFALISPVSVKYVSLSLLFVAVVMLAIMLYVLPFFYNIFITYKKTRKKDNAQIEQ